MRLRQRGWYIIFIHALTFKHLNRRDGGSADQLSVNGIPLRRQQLYWRVIALQRTQRLQRWLRRVRMRYVAAV